MATVAYLPTLRVLIWSGKQAARGNDGMEISTDAGVEEGRPG